MTEGQNIFKYNNRFNIISLINILNQTYQIKNSLKNNIFSYRCYNVKYKSVIHIRKEDLLTYENSKLFQIPIFKSLREHSEECLNIINNCNNLNNNTELPYNINIEKLIETNIFKPFAFHKTLIKKIIYK